MMPATILEAATLVTGALAAAGTLQGVAASLLVRRFVRRRAEPAARAKLPPVTILKPLHGDEPLLEEALASFCRQDYPVQVVFGVQRSDDPAIQVVERLRARFPDLDMTLVVDASPHGPNRKVDNLINMLPHARHDLLVISDADVHAAPDLTRSVLAPLRDQRVGLVTTLYTGLPASRAPWRLLGAAQINQAFLPGALLGRAMGRRDCLGAVMALSASTLAAIGGFRALSPHLADDAVLGRKVRALGLEVALAPAMPATSVTEGSFGELFSHELRWGRTMRGQAPIGYPMSVLQAPIAWALLLVLLSAGAPYALAALAAVWGLRSWLGRDAERVLCGRVLTPFWMVPLRDLLSLAVIIASHAGGGVVWRGRTLHISAQKNLHADRVSSERRPLDPPLWRPANLKARP